MPGLEPVSSLFAAQTQFRNFARWASLQEAVLHQFPGELVTRSDPEPAAVIVNPSEAVSGSSPICQPESVVGGRFLRGLSSPGEEGNGSRPGSASALRPFMRYRCGHRLLAHQHLEAAPGGLNWAALAAFLFFSGRGSFSPTSWLKSPTPSPWPWRRVLSVCKCLTGRLRLASKRPDWKLATTCWRLLSVRGHC